MGDISRHRKLHSVKAIHHTARGRYMNVPEYEYALSQVPADTIG